MNALIQQLVMVPGLSEAFLTVQAVKAAGRGAEDSASSSSNNNLEDDQLYSFQQLLLPLVMSNAASIDPSAFISRFSFFGEPVNPQQQMDSQEFLSVFFEHLSGSLSRTTRPLLLQDFFAGRLSNRIYSLSCPHRHSREEPFFILSLPIQHHRDIRGSLSEFVKGELLEGANAYWCNDCGGKVDAERRSLIAALPPVLILHLKRFEFDFDTMRKKKLNDECSFPRVLNMQPYADTQAGAASPEAAAQGSSAPAADRDDNGGSKEVAAGTEAGDREAGAEAADETASSASSLPSEAQQDADFYYDLVGVVIHSGHADGGHYWSLVKNQFVSAGSQASGSAWLQFNDQRISPFCIDDLAEEAFGGMEQLTVETSSGGKEGKVTEEIRVEKQRSAYMLFYAKRTRPPVVERAAQQEEKDGLQGLQRPSPLSSQAVFPSSLPLSSLPLYLHEMYASLTLANLQLLREQLSFDPPYAVFMLRCFLHAYDKMQRNDGYPARGLPNPASHSLRLCQSVSLFLLNVSTRAKNSKRLEQFTALLQQMLWLHAPACFWLLDRLSKSEAALSQALLDSSSTSRRSVCAVLDVAMTRLVGMELDPDYVEKWTPTPIPDKDKERQAAEADGEMPLAAPSASASPAVPSSLTASPSASAPSSASSSPAGTPVNSPPPIPPRTIVASSAPSSHSSTPPATPPLPPRALPTVNASLAPDGMFKVKSAVSLSSPLTVLNGIGAPSAKALTAAGISSIQLLAQVRERKDFNVVLANCKLSSKQMADAVAKAKAACAFIRQIGGDEQVKPPPPAPPAPLDTVELKQNGVTPPRRSRDFVGCNEPYSVLPRFVTACLALLQSVVAAGNADSAASMETVELLTRLAKKSPACARLLIDKGALDVLIALYLGRPAAAGEGKETSQASSGSRTATEVQTATGSRRNSFSSVSNQTLDGIVSVPPLPPLPELASSSSSSSAQLPSPMQLSPAVSSARPSEKSYLLEYDQSPILILLALLVRYCRLQHWGEALPATFVPSTSPPPLLSPHTHSLLVSPLFLSRLATHPTIKSNVVQTDLACHLCWFDLSASRVLLQAILLSLQQNDASKVWPALCQLQGLLTLGDDELLLSQRILLALPPFLLILSGNQAYYKLTDLCLRFLLSLLPSQPLLLPVLHSQLEQLDWVQAWLQLTKKPPTRSQPIFCDDGRVVQLWRDLDDRQEGSKDDAWQYKGMGDLSKLWKQLLDDAKKKRDKDRERERERKDSTA